MALRGIRGAITVTSNTKSLIVDATKELLSQIFNLLSRTFFWQVKKDSNFY